jgi:beta-mannanase
VQKATSLEQAGIVPMVTWQPERLRTARVQATLRAIASGKFDWYIRAYAEGVRRYGGPLFLRPMHEMDGYWYPWSAFSRGNTPREFVAVWRRMHDIFREVGATNATWVWSVNHYSVPHVPKNRIERYWPGSAYVDWVGVSGLNPGPVRNPYRWESFDRVNRPRYLELLRFHKPVMIAETASPEIGGDKAQWIGTMFGSILQQYPKVGALMWFDSRDPKFPTRNDWRVNSSPSALAAFRRGIDNPRVMSAPAAAYRAEGHS